MIMHLPLEKPWIFFLLVANEFDGGNAVAAPRTILRRDDFSYPASSMPIPIPATETSPADVDSKYLSTCGDQALVQREINCELSGGIVDIYYWPEPDANTACLSIVGNNTISPLPGASGGYWSCTAVSRSSFITTAKEIITGTVTLKEPLVNPWSPQPCIKTLNMYPSLKSLNHALKVPRGITQNEGLPITTVVRDNYTFTSPYLYAKFHNLSASGAWGISTISEVILNFTSGELSTIAGPPPPPYYREQSTAPFNPADLPCPPQSVMEENWYMPQPGVPYRPIVVVPQKLTELNAFLKMCTAIFFTAIDPPQALVSISKPALLPPVPPSSAKPVLAQTSTQNPGNKDHITTAVPGLPPLRDLPQATRTPVKISNLVLSSPKLQPNDPTAHTISPSQPRPGSGDSKLNSDPEKSSQSSVKFDQKQHPNIVAQSDPKQTDDIDPNETQSKQRTSSRNILQTPTSLSSPDNIIFESKAPILSSIFSNPPSALTEGQLVTIYNKVKQPFSHSVSVAGTTLPPGAPPMTASGTPIFYGSSVLDIGTNTVPFATQVPLSVSSSALARGQITTTSKQVDHQHSHGVSITGTTLTPGSSPKTGSGISVIYSPSLLVGATNREPLASDSDVSNPRTTTIAGHAVTTRVSSMGIAGASLIAGGLANTRSNIPVSLSSSTPVRSTGTVTLPSQPTEPLITAIADHTFTAATNAVEVAGTIISPGVSGVTLDGTLVSLDTSGHLTLGINTMTLTGAGATSRESGDQSASNTMSTAVANQTVTIAPNAVTFAGTALTPGALGKSINGMLVYSNTAGQPVVKPTTTPLESNSAGSGGFPAGGPLGSGSLLPTQGNFSDATKSITTSGVQVFQGGAEGSDRVLLWKMVAVSTIAMGVLIQM